MDALSLLGGPDLRAGAETAASHTARLGPVHLSGPALIAALERSDLRGRGGAGFPVGRKWRSVAGRRGPRVVVANGAEGEPLSLKDRLLMQARPHLVLDGAALAGGAVGAGDIVVYVGGEHRAALDSLRRALAERPHRERRHIRLVEAPRGYVAGEATAAVQFLSTGVALPASTPPRPNESGVGGRPTLIQNVETLAAVALIARHGDAWYRDHATGLVTVSGSVLRPGVVEVPLGTSIGEVAERAGLEPGGAQAVLLGGYFGGWVTASHAWGLPLHPVRLRDAGLSLGCAVVAPLSAERCGVAETARIVAYLAGESAGQCGPCVFGLGAIARALHRVATHLARPDDLALLDRWSAELPGRGACHHPDGAATLVRSALTVFAEDFHLHHGRRGCTARPAVSRGAA